jgi:PTH1 family peptidyl-tRNA hydrolase
MLLFAGLGNPGPQYSGNRHNIGFLAVDAVHRRHRFSPWRRRFHGETAEGEIEQSRILLLKPETFMNESGLAVQQALTFYKMESTELFVFHDELDLPLGKVRTKRGGGDAGHNGLRSITKLCGPYYTRIRLGIGHPGDKLFVSRHVLSDFSQEESEMTQFICETIAEVSGHLVAGDAEKFQNHVHRLLAEKYPSKDVEPN